jgi:hypothetical protein
MRAYNFYFLNKAGMIAAAELVECEGDADAQQVALTMLRSTHHHSVEVRVQARLVSSQERDPAWVDSESPRKE